MMKKSEIIKLMVDELKTNSLDSEAEMKSAMEHVLFVMEQNGMLPPRAPIPGTNFSDNYWEKEE
jgi:hypothetical protein